MHPLTAASASPATDPRFDAVCLGESMVTFLPSRPGGLAEVPSFERALGGAESNVACTLAGAGHSARWVSRVGADGFGDYLVQAVSSYGVDTSAVTRDPERRTGVYFRTGGERPTGIAPSVPSVPGASGARQAEVLYYRSGSAASAISPQNTDTADTDAGRVLHLTGITPALSEDCLALMRALTAPRPGRPLVSFDVNLRIGLWREAPDTPDVLLELARGCDLVFVGEDEAEAAWGITGGPRAIRSALPEPAALVVKQGPAGATAFTGDAPTGVFSPAPSVEVVTPVGAGDAFAAGFLSASLRGLELAARLRHGHLTAAAALTVPGDLAAPPSRRHADTLAGLSDDAWGTLRLAPGWTEGARPCAERAAAP
ncbi:sugar kinase [Nocardiopsis baichengensis]|uniref:sugar kinase n=1 Tax=Nocardiopsis baichengensis TaxID=280240 RepID=UPI00034D0C29|nr:sugar kinase [Nocardiopsis baichengensis]